jgi:alkylation response protein AidB-like acyl-CoA dehydrogenase
MPQYDAPLADIRFAVHDLVGLSRINALPGYEDAQPDLVDQIFDEAARFANEVLAPLNPLGDRQGCAFENGVVRMPPGFVDAYRQFVDGGWNGMHFPVEVEGQGLPRLVSTAVSEIWHAANMAFGLCPMLTQGAAEVVAAYGSDALKAEYLPSMVSGRFTGTMNLTEPQAGSDLGRLRTRAVPDGDHYRITGQKIYITYGEHDLSENIIHMVLARTPDAPPGVRGISLFLVPKYLDDGDGKARRLNDVRCVSIEHKLGINASPTAVLSYGDNGGAIGFLLGEENRGLEEMFRMMNSARLAVGLEGVGIADRAFQRARAFAHDRVQGRRLGGDDPSPVAIIHHPDVQRMLLSMKAQTEAARALAYYVAGMIDIAERSPDDAERHRADAVVDLLTPVVKGWSTDVGIEVADTGIQVFGGMGYVEESGAPQHLRDARIAAIYEGTNGIQAMDLVGRKIARDNGAAMASFIATLRETGAGQASESDESAGAIQQRLNRAIDDLERSTDWIVRTFADDPRRVAAGAVDYMHLTGIVAGGWLMGRAAQIARDRLAAGEGDPAYLRAKLITARFFADTELACSASLYERIISTGGALDELDVDAGI